MEIGSRLLQQMIVQPQEEIGCVKSTCYHMSFESLTCSLRRNPRDALVLLEWEVRKAAGRVSVSLAALTASALLSCSFLWT